MVICSIQDMVENLRIAFWVYKKDESRKIRIETERPADPHVAFRGNKKDESRKIRIETLSQHMVDQFGSVNYKKDESRKIRIET